MAAIPSNIPFNPTKHAQAADQFPRDSSSSASAPKDQSITSSSDPFSSAPKNSSSKVGAKDNNAYFGYLLKESLQEASAFLKQIPDLPPAGYHAASKSVARQLKSLASKHASEPNYAINVAASALRNALDKRFEEYTPQFFSMIALAKYLTDHTKADGILIADHNLDKIESDVAQNNSGPSAIGVVQPTLPTMPMPVAMPGSQPKQAAQVKTQFS